MTCYTDQRLVYTYLRLVYTYLRLVYTDLCLVYAADIVHNVAVQGLTFGIQKTQLERESFHHKDYGSKVCIDASLLLQSVMLVYNFLHKLLQDSVKPKSVK